MKKLKKIMALVIAMAMVVAMGTTAFAEDAELTPEYIKLAETDTHTYKVFQVLTGTLASEGSKNLGNPAWGADATAAAQATDVNTFIASLNGKSETEIANLVAAKVDTTGNGRGTVDKDNPITGLAKGYYVLVDVTDLTDDDFKNDTAALNVVKVVNNIDALAIKHGTTQDDKTITGDTLGANGSTFNPGEDNDNVSVGDTVHYNIAATVPDNADKFKEGTFFFVITDKLSTGLTFTTGSLKVYDGTTELSADKYTVQYNINGNTFEVGLINAASYKGKTINVKYDAVLNENAVIGDAGNPNTSTVKFSNDPNKTYDGSPEDTNHPGFPDSTKEVPTGETPESETKTFTTGIEILKVDQDGKVLTGATFKIKGDSVKTVLKVTQTFTAADDGEYYKLKDGTYTKTAPTTEETMVEAEAGATAGYVVADDTYDGEDKKVVGGVTYRPYVPETDTGATIYVLKESNADLYDSTTTKYKKTETKTAENTGTNHEASQAVDSNGLARFDGLGAGTYTISETVTPSGYNTVSDVSLTVTFDEDGTAKFSASGATYEDGVLKIRVENRKGTELPETGGIGTTIFYIVGAILVLGAGVVMVTRRRMDA